MLYNSQHVIFQRFGNLQLNLLSQFSFMDILFLFVVADAEFSHFIDSQKTGEPKLVRRVNNLQLTVQGGSIIYSHCFPNFELDFLNWTN